MFLLNSPQGLLSATPRGSLRKGVHPQGHPFSRSYGVNLPSSLARVLPSASALLCLPTCGGLRYGHSTFIGCEAFLGSVGSARSGRVSPPLLSPLSSGEGFASRPHRLEGRTPEVIWAPSLPSCVPPQPPVEWGRNINRLPFGYAFRPRLRTRLTLRRSTSRRKPWAFGGGGFHTPWRYSCPDSLFPQLQKTSRPSFSAEGMLPYR